MNMTRKHFRSLAKIMKDNHPGEGPIQQHPYADELWQEIVDALADFCAEENPLFDRAKFLDACRS